MTNQKNLTFILKAVAGSHAHGLVTENSDRDLHGVYSAPSQDFWGLSKPEESIVLHDPDEAYHELKKFLLLCLKGNPTVLELLYMDEYIEMEPVWGQRLLDLAPLMLSAKAVKDSYLGYAMSQHKRMWERAEDGTPQYMKLARHAFRLLDQGYELYTSGYFHTSVHPEDREFYLTIGARSKDEIERLYSEGIERFLNAETVLPERPDILAVEGYLIEYRANHL
jgi:uncharacterized protein